MDDCEQLMWGKSLEGIKGKLCGNKEYTGQTLFENLFLNGMHLVAKVIK